MVPNMKIEIIKAGPFFIAKAYDDLGCEICCVTEFSRKAVNRLIHEKTGMREITPSLKSKKNSKKKKKVTKKNYFGNSGSVMTGLIGVTSSRNWKHVK